MIIKEIIYFILILKLKSLYYIFALNITIFMINNIKNMLKC